MSAHVGASVELQLEPVVLFARSPSKVRPRHGFGFNVNAGQNRAAVDVRARTSEKRYAPGLISPALAKERLGASWSRWIDEVLGRANPRWCVSSRSRTVMDGLVMDPPYEPGCRAVEAKRS